MLWVNRVAFAEEAKAANTRTLGVPAEILGASRLLPSNQRSMDVAPGLLPKDCHLTPARFMAD